MASANVDLVRSIYAAWERGDYSSTEWAHPDIEFVVADGPSPGSSTLAGVAESWRGVLGAWDELRFNVEDYRELDAERVLVLVDFSGRGKTSGLELGQVRANGAHLLHVRGGKVTRHVFYWDRERALADLGLAPEATPRDGVGERGSRALDLLGLGARRLQLGRVGAARDRARDRRRALTWQSGRDWPKQMQAATS